MTIFLPSYHLGTRIAKIYRSMPNETVSGEGLVLARDGFGFLSDHSLYHYQNPSKTLSEMHDGDIIIINERGIAKTIFDANDGDATIFLGGNCNSNCVMCPSSEYERRMDYSENDFILQQYLDLLPAQLKFYTVTGGEPTLNRNSFLWAMQKLSEKFPNANALLLTNGRSFSDINFVNEFFKICPPYLLAGIPLHGASSEIHDQITRSPGSFRQTTKGIRNLLNQGISIEIRIVVTKMNCQNIDAIANLICSEFSEVSYVNFISLEVRGNCYTNREEVVIDPRESFKKCKSAIDMLIDNGINVNLYNYPLCCVDDRYWFLCKKSISPQKVRYSKECTGCILQKACGGMFESTIKTAMPRLEPRYSESNYD